jgi:hypothetical protein
MRLELQASCTSHISGLTQGEEGAYELVQGEESLGELTRGEESLSEGSLCEGGSNRFLRKAYQGQPGRLVGLLGDASVSKSGEIEKNVEI